MNGKPKIVIRWIGILGILVCSYILLLMIGQAIPKERVFNNVKKSYESIDEIGLYFNVVEGAQWDNWTDTYFLNAAVTEYDGNLLEKALANAYTVSVNSERRVIDDLSASINNGEKAGISLYSRYWAGNLTLYKILLMFMPIEGIRNLLLAVTLLLFLFASINIYRLLGYKGAVPFILCIIACKYIPLSMCLTFSSDIILMLIVINFLALDFLHKQEIDWKRYYILFGCVGSVCAYLGYWAFPLITLGIPMVFATMFRIDKEVDSEKNIIVDNIIISIFWACGVCVTVCIKQILCYFILGSQSGTNALSQRIGAEYSWLKRLESTGKVIENSLTDGMVIMLIIITILLIAYSIYGDAHIDKYGFKAMVILGCYPVIWCFIWAQHNMHGFVTYMYGVTYYSILCMIFLKIKRVFIDKKRILYLACIWGGVTCFVSQMHYDNMIQKPWSIDTTEVVELNHNRIEQNVNFDVEKPIHLKYIKVLLDYSDTLQQIDEGILTVTLSDENKIIHQEKLSIKSKQPTMQWQVLENEGIVSHIINKIVRESKWTKIKMDCTIYPKNSYKITYSLDVADSTIGIKTQEIAQAAPANELLYINGESVNYSIVNRYYYNYAVPVKIKIYVIFILLLIIVKAYTWYVKRR